MHVFCGNQAIVKQLVSPVVITLSPLQPVQATSAGFPASQALAANLSYGTQKSGFLLKKSDGKVRCMKIRLCDN